MELIKRHITQTPGLTPAELARLTGRKRTTVTKDLVRLARRGEVVSQFGCYFEAPRFNIEDYNLPKASMPVWLALTLQWLLMALVAGSIAYQIGDANYYIVRHSHLLKVLGI